MLQRPMSSGLNASDSVQFFTRLTAIEVFQNHNLDCHYFSSCYSQYQYRYIYIGDTTMFQIPNKLLEIRHSC